MGNCIWIDLLESSFFIYCPDKGKCCTFNDVLTTDLGFQLFNFVQYFSVDKYC